MLRHDYNLTERALAFWCPLTLGIMAVTSLGLRFATDPVTCWIPPVFNQPMVDFAKETCYRTTEKFEMIDEFTPLHTDRLPTKQPSYHHQWTPFSFGIAAILCLLPHALWRVLSGLLWLDPHGLARTLADNQRQNAAQRHVMLKDSALMVQAGLRGGNWALSAAAMGRKALALVVCILQVVLIVVLFRPQLGAESQEGSSSSGSGSGSAKEDGGKGAGEEDGVPGVTGAGVEGLGLGLGMWEEEEESHERSPITGFRPQERFICDLTVRTMKDAGRYSFQCTMPLAQVYSKAFTFLFYLFLLLTLCCLLDILVSLGRLLIPGLRDASLKRYLAVGGAEDTDHGEMRRFLDGLGMDGRLLVAVTGDVCGPVAAADLTNHLWMVFKSSHRPGTVAMPGPSASVAGPVPAVVSTVPPAPPGAGGGAAVLPSPAGPSGNAEAIPLLPMGGEREEVKVAQA
ncbi:innexin unc-9-like [Babylonia areolata]|uniref:innexin unc-9-like n=1 Tax=Babylonia areolata TaxID=304850 RepID=UPI003FD2BE7C